MENENQDYVIPGDRTGVTEEGMLPPNIPTPKDRKWWLVLCPACGEIHHRMVKEEWEDYPEAVLTDAPVGGHVVHYEFFVCIKNRLHFKIEAEWPFGILYKTSYSPKPLRDAEEGVKYFTKKERK
jgi:hypothetical protein